MTPILSKEQNIHRNTKYRTNTVPQELTYQKFFGSCHIGWIAPLTAAFDQCLHQQETRVKNMTLKIFMTVSASSMWGALGFLEQIFT